MSQFNPMNAANFHQFAAWADASGNGDGKVDKEELRQANRHLRQEMQTLRRDEAQGRKDGFYTGGMQNQLQAWGQMQQAGQAMIKNYGALAGGGAAITPESLRFATSPPPQTLLATGMLFVPQPMVAMPFAPTLQAPANRMGLMMGQVANDPLSQVRTEAVRISQEILILDNTVVQGGPEDAQRLKTLHEKENQLVKLVEQEMQLQKNGSTSPLPTAFSTQKETSGTLHLHASFKTEDEIAALEAKSSQASQQEPEDVIHTKNQIDALIAQRNALKTEALQLQGLAVASRYDSDVNIEGISLQEVREKAQLLVDTMHELTNLSSNLEPNSPERSQMEQRRDMLMLQLSTYTGLEHHLLKQDGDDGSPSIASMMEASNKALGI